MSERKAVPETGDAALARYLREIGRIPLLKREQEIELARSIRRGDQQALNQLVEANLRFVVNFAKKYQGCGIALLDLINEGNIGLIEAAKRFDPDRGVKFISYAVWWIRQAIMQTLAEQCGVVRLPVKQAGLLYKVGQEVKRLQQELGREPTAGEVARELNLSPEEIEVVLRVSRKAVPLDYSGPDGDKSTPLLNLPDESLDQMEQTVLGSSISDDIQELLSRLEPREAEILRLHFGLAGEEPLTLERIGERYGLTRERIRQIEVKAKSKLRRIARRQKLADHIH